MVLHDTREKVNLSTYPPRDLTLFLRCFFVFHTQPAVVIGRSQNKGSQLLEFSRLGVGLSRGSFPPLFSTFATTFAHVRPFEWAASSWVPRCGAVAGLVRYNSCTTRPPSIRLIHFFFSISSQLIIS
jgi:hypothetical protein